MSANSKVATRIRERREELAARAEDVARQSGVDLQRYYGIERGDRKITVDDLYQIAPALDTTPVWLCRDLCDDRTSD